MEKANETPYGMADRWTSNGLGIYSAPPTENEKKLVDEINKVIAKNKGANI